MDSAQGGRAKAWAALPRRLGPQHRHKVGLIAAEYLSPIYDAGTLLLLVGQALVENKEPNVDGMRVHLDGTAGVVAPAC